MVISSLDRLELEFLLLDLVLLLLLNLLQYLCTTSSNTAAECFLTRAADRSEESAHSDVLPNRLNPCCLRRLRKRVRCLIRHRPTRWGIGIRGRRRRRCWSVGVWSWRNHSAANRIRRSDR